MFFVHLSDGCFRKAGFFYIDPAQLYYQIAASGDAGSSRVVCEQLHSRDPGLNFHGVTSRMLTMLTCSRRRDQVPYSLAQRIFKIYYSVTSIAYFDESAGSSMREKDKEPPSQQIPL